MRCSGVLLIVMGSSAPSCRSISVTSEGNADPSGDRHAAQSTDDSLVDAVESVASATAQGWYLLRVMLGDGNTPRAVQVLVEIAGSTASSHWVAVTPGLAGAGLSMVLPLSARACVVFRDELGRRLNARALLTPLTHRQAVVRMLGGLRRRAGGPGLGAAIGVLATTVGALLVNGVHGAADGFAGSYRLALRQRAARLASAAAMSPARLQWRWWQLACTARGALEPIRELRAKAATGGWEWEATGDHPQFAVRAPGVGWLPAGWYLLRMRLRAHGGRIIAPCLVAAAGGGATEANAIPRPDRGGQVRMLVLLKAPAVALRFDPSMRRASFGIDDFRFENVTRVRAWLEMVRGLRRPRLRAKSTLVGVCAGFLRDVVACGLSDATTTLFARYAEGACPGVVSYLAWTRMYDTFSKADLILLSERARQMEGGPLISILVPVYDAPERWLRNCLDSVLMQAYANWELCIADDASPAPHVRRILDEYSRRDARVRVVHRERNGHIAAASNTALDMAGGAYVALLDHDDELRPHSLLEVVEALSAAPDACLVYSDEDKIDASGKRCQPYFKPDWNQDLLLSQNYLCHFTVVRTDLARSVGGFREGYEGSQDHDLFLRCTHQLRTDQILHIPKVLYHWRAIEGSTALRRDAKDYAADAGARAVSDHLARCGHADATIEQLPHGHYRVRWPLPTPAPRVTVIVPTRDRVELLRACVESLFEVTRYPDFDLIVVDNQSADSATLEYLQELEQRQRVRVLRYDRPFNYSAMNNMAVAASTSELVALLNNDIEVTSPDWLGEMASHAVRPDIGAVGAMLYYPDGSIQHAGVILGLGGVANHAYMRQPRGYPGHGGRTKVTQNLSAVTAACLVVRRSAYMQVGGLDENFAVAFNDVDFCLRLRESGLRNLWTPFAELVHHESASRGRDDSDEKALRFQGEVTLMEARWGNLLRADPAYNPNLSLASVNSEIASPPRRHERPAQPPRPRL
jgi:GT2 family glycosyltransferase